MKKLLSTLALTVAVSAGCGLDGVFNNTDMPTACPASLTLFRIPTGTYTTSAVQVTQDTCNTPPLTPAELMTNRTVENDTTAGNIVVKGSTGAELGRGPVRCNTGQLTFGPSVINDTACSYTTTRTSTIQVTADATFTLTFSDSRTMVTNVNNCKIPASGCTVSWSATMKQ